MDKLKEQLAVVARHSFWIMCSTILVVCLVSWYLSTKSLYEQQQKQYTDITQNFSAMQQVMSSNPKHPNPQTAEGMAQLLRAYSLEVMKGWQQQYDQQADVLVWPASFDDQFKEQVNKLRPIEIVPPPPTPIAMDLEIRDRQLYRDFIADELPALAETIGAQWRASAAAVRSGGGYGGADAGGYGGSGLGGSGLGGLGLGGGYSGDSSMASGYPGSGYPGDSGVPGAGAVIDKSIVIWSGTNQQELLNTHFGFISSEEPPSTLDVLYAQEDLWVLQNIMDVIRDANRDADGNDAGARHEATVKMIDFVRIGRSAMGMAGRISPVGAQAAAGMGGYGSMEMSSDMGSAGMGPTGSDAGSGAGTMPADSSGGSAGMPGMSGDPYSQVINTDPAFGRYVNEKYESLDPKRLREAWTSKNPADALLAVAKRMPVRMRFTIDQRRLNKLKAACGNSRLPVEVRQVRINREPAPAGGMGGGYGGYGGDGGDYGGGGMGLGGSMPGGGMGGLGMPGMSGLGGMGGMDGGYPGDTMSSDSYGGMPGMGGMGRPGVPRAVGGANSTAAIDPNLIVVELYGIVYIYNPVNKSQLGLDDPTTTVAAPPAEPPSAPATPPATPVSTPAPSEAPAPTTSVPPAAIVPGVGGGQ